MPTVPRLALLAGPVALAFFAGGFGDDPRLVALGVAGVGLAWVALTTPGSLVPAAPAARIALTAFVALTAWVAISQTWAPLTDAAGDDAERWALYALALVAGTLAWRRRDHARWVEPGVAAGILVVTGYGMAGRLLPWLVPQTASRSAGGRFEQPLTYWNASGGLAAVGVVLCVRLAGDPERAGWLRCAAVAAAVPLAAGTYLSFSRGALVALAAGLLVLLVLAPTWPQLRSAAIVLEVAAVGLVGPALSPSVRSLAGDAAARDRQGALVLVAMSLAAAAGVALLRWELRDERRRRGRRGALGLPRWAGTLATAGVVALVVVPVLAARGDPESSANPAFGATSSRLVSAGSHRYDYWKVAVHAWEDHPVAGLGTGGYAVAWLRERPQPERIRDAHSLPLEVLAELGLVGFLLLVGTAGAVAVAARRVQAGDPGLAAGLAAGLVAYAVRASIDWDWELPATGLVALSLAAALLAQAPGRRRVAGEDAAPSVTRRDGAPTVARQDAAPVVGPAATG